MDATTIVFKNGFMVDEGQLKVTNNPCVISP